MSKLEKYVQINLDEEQQDELRGLLVEIEKDCANYSDGKSRKAIIAQVMNTDGGQVFLMAAIATEEMVKKIREITGAE